MGSNMHILGLNDKQKRSTMLIKQLTAESEALIEIGDQELRQDLQKIYEAFLYSDPVSNDMLTQINMKIEREFLELKRVALDGDRELAHDMTTNLLALIKERNVICKAAK